MGMFDDLPNAPAGTTVQNGTVPNMFADLPDKTDWSKVQTSADVQKVLDAQPTPEAKTAALKDWAAQRVAKEAAAGFAPQESPAEYVPGSGLVGDIGAGVNALVSAVTGGKHGNTFEQERALQHAREQYAYEHSTPLGHAAAVTGGVIAGMGEAPLSAAGLPIAATAPTVASAPGILARTANAAKIGAVYGGVTGAGEGDTAQESLTDALKGAGIGAATGAVLNPVAEGVGNAVRYAADAMKPLPPELQTVGRGAADNLVQAIQDDNLSPTIFRQRQRELGPEGMLADMGPNLQLHAGAIANRASAGRGILSDALEARNEAAPAAMEAAVTQAMGPQQNLTRLEINTAANANAQAAPSYQQFEANPLPMTPDLLQGLREAEAWGATRPAMQMLRGQSLPVNALDRLNPDPLSPLTGNNVNPLTLTPTGREIDYTKRALNTMASKAFADGDAHKGTLINETAQRLTDAVDNILSPANPAASPYAQGRAAAQVGKGFSQGLREGAGTFSKPATHGPDIVNYDMDPTRPGYSPAYEAGYRAAARGDLAHMANDATSQFGPTGDRALRKGLFSPNAERKIEMMAQSPQAADELMRVRDAQTTFAGTRNEVLKNSATARRTAAQKLYPNPQERDPVSGNLTTTATGLAVAGGKKLLNAMLLGHINRRLDAMATGAARVLSATGMDRDAYFSSLQRYMQTRGMSARQAAAVTRQVRQLALSTIPAETRGESGR